MICVIDYGMGNLRSVSKALERVGARVVVSGRPRDLERAEKIVLPGVGGFGHAMSELKKRRLIAPILESLEKEKPFLGICLGLQLLFNKSQESPGVRGLCTFPGEVRAFSKKRLKVPHMGWNRLELTKPSPLMKRVSNGSFFYFVHSYYGAPTSKNLVAGRTDYGISFASFIQKEPVFALQFHPEKSQAAGLQILKNFVAY